ncbi:MAG: hypothetical protein GXP08_08795 [Gammaproteobacteria bacterium]|nr:hypothetical protein [Gammaproteobacteria bacterium]
MAYLTNHQAQVAAAAPPFLICIADYADDDSAANNTTNNITHFFVNDYTKHDFNPGTCKGTDT